MSSFPVLSFALFLPFSFMPRGYWDDYMRLGSTRAGRQCVRPEVCRTYNFGATGSST